MTGPANAASRTPSDPRYPIGRFQFDGDRSPESRERYIAQIAALPAELRSAVHGLAEHQLDTPYREGGWTIRQVAHHIPDSHMNAYVRFKLALTEDQPTITPYEEARWAALPDTRDTPVMVSVRMLEALHERWVVLMRDMSDADFARAYMHPEQKRAVPLFEALPMYAWHGRHHVAHILATRAREGWV